MAFPNAKKRTAITRTVGIAIIIVVLIVAIVAAAYAVSSSSKTTTSSTSSIVSSSVTGPANNLTLSVAISGASTSVDPSMEDGTPQYEYTLGYQTLVTVPWYNNNDSYGAVQPLLATSWNVSPNGLTYTFNLRQGVKFQDGTAFNSTAVPFIVTRTLDLNDHQASFLANIANVTTPSTYVAVITLKTPDPYFIYTVASVSMMPMVSPSGVVSHEVTGNATGGNGTDYGQAWLATHEDGTGPYILTSYVPNTSFTGTAWSGYWGGWSGSHFTNIVAYMITDASTSASDIESGQVGMAFSLAVSDANSLASNPQYTVDWVNERAVTYLIPDISNPYLAQTDFRKAIAYAINYTAALEACCGTHSEQASGPLPAVSPAYNSTTPYPQQNVTLAKEYLAMTNYTAAGSPTLTIAINSELQWKIDDAQVISANLAAIGINVKILEQSDSTVFSEITTPGAASMYLWFEPMEVFDPISILSYMFDGYLVSSPPSNPPVQIDNLLTEAGTVANNATAYDAILEQIQGIAVQQQYLIYLAQQYDNVVLNNNVVSGGYQLWGGDGFSAVYWYALTPGPDAT